MVASHRSRARSRARTAARSEVRRLSTTGTTGSAIDGFADDGPGRRLRPTRPIATTHSAGQYSSDSCRQSDTDCSPRSRDSRGGIAPDRAQTVREHGVRDQIARPLHRRHGQVPTSSSLRSSGQLELDGPVGAGRLRSRLGPLTSPRCRRRARVRPAGGSRGDVRGEITRRPARRFSSSTRSSRAVSVRAAGSATPSPCEAALASTGSSRDGTTRGGFGEIETVPQGRHPAEPS